MKAVADRGPAVTPESFLRQLTALGQWKGVRDRLGELRVPVLVAKGTTDVMLPAYRSYVISQDVGDVELHVTDLALGVPLSERIAQKCGRDATRCALWLEGRYGEKPPFPSDHPQYEVLKVGDVVDEPISAGHASAPTGVGLLLSAIKPVGPSCRIASLEFPDAPSCLSSDRE